jgi:hypothetical protein
MLNLHVVGPEKAQFFFILRMLMKQLLEKKIIFFVPLVNFVLLYYREAEPQLQTSTEEMRSIITVIAATGKLW